MSPYSPQYHNSSWFGDWWWVIVLVIVGIAAAIYLIYTELGRRHSTRLFLRNQKVPQIMKDLTPLSFEIWVRGLFINIGADAILSKRESKTGFDHGIDLVAHYKGQKICIQCKKYFPNRLVDETILRDLYGAMEYGKYDKAVLVTTSSFTRRAREWAEKADDMILINGELLQKMRDNTGILINLLNK
ncbi:MAG TPA: restriction endonuclease [Patescibacteria group bacterium]|nr:restriction endonuclease [Patescibacteria group bacterium]